MLPVCARVTSYCAVTVDSNAHQLRLERRLLARGLSSPPDNDGISPGVLALIVQLSMGDVFSGTFTGRFKDI